MEFIYADNIFVLQYIFPLFGSFQPYKSNTSFLLL